MKVSEETKALLGTKIRVTENKERYLKYFVLWGAIINLILNFILIKPFGAIGVAVATLISQFCVSIVAPFIYKETRESTMNIIKSLNFIKIFKNNNISNLILLLIKKKNTTK